MKDDNKNGYIDLIDNLIYFLVAIVPIGILLAGVVLLAVGINKKDKDIQAGGSNLAAMGGVGTGLSLIKKPNSND